MNQRSARPSRARETAKLVAAVQCLLKAIGGRAAEEDPEVLVELQDLRTCVEIEILNAVRAQRSCGVTWEQIGSVTGTTRQAAIMKWAHRL